MINALAFGLIGLFLVICVLILWVNRLAHDVNRASAIQASLNANTNARLKELERNRTAPPKRDPVKDFQTL